MRKFLLFLTVITFVSCSSPGQEAKSVNDMFTQVCERGQNVKGPWQGDLILSSMDSSGFKKGQAQTFVKSGGVPTITQDSRGRLIAAFQWFTCEDSAAFDKIAVKISEDEGLTWSEPQSIKIEGMDGYQRPFDPTLVSVDGGQIRMYFTSSEGASMIFGESMKIYSAISDDGVNYVFESGARFSIETAAAYDAAVGYFNGLWYLITPKNNDFPKGAHLATSEDGLTFTRQADIVLNEEVNWTGNFVVDGSAVLYFYGTGNGQNGNWYTKTENGETWNDPVYLKSNFGGDPAVFGTGSGEGYGDSLIVSTQMLK